MTIRIVAARPEDAAAIESLVDNAFGQDRQKRTVYRLRDGIEPIASLSLVAVTAARDVVGSIKFWPILLPKDDGNVPALLLGPIAVRLDYRGAGVGGRLMRRGLDLAKAQKHRIVLLVGDAPYYGRFGFKHDLVVNLTLPGPVDLDRFLGLELEDGALNGIRGLVQRSDISKK